MPNLPNEEASCNRITKLPTEWPDYLGIELLCIGSRLPRIADDESRLQTGQN